MPVGLVNAALNNPLLWRQIDGYLSQVLDLEPDARDPWLADLAATQPVIVARLRELLANREQLDNGFLHGAPLSVSDLEALARASAAGEQIGGYTLDRHLGSGGMGEVWLAARSDGRFEGQFAIKFLDSSLAQPKVVQRFHHEGRLLARLGHPNIARLVDAGATDDGRQFLVLEYVDGERIDRYCDSRQLTIKERVRLFLGAVTAVAHAHRNLIVHRDLKPSNVLVTRDGIVKLLDFGIARLLSTDPSANDGTPTRIEDMALTPEYAAPEQLMGELPTTATDVYQLGMLLYVLLTGRHPLDRKDSRAERIKAALAHEMPRASQSVDGALQRELRGDLDAVLEQALQTDASRRYPAAESLREDLVRYLGGEPVNARRGTAVYRMRKFVARHRVAVLGSAVAVAGLCAALVFAAGQARIAGAERDRALELASRNLAVTDVLSTMLTEIADADHSTMSKMLVRVEKLMLTDTGDNRENRAAVLAMVASRYEALGNSPKAAEALERALDLLQDSHADGLRSELICGRALVISSMGESDAALRAITHELEDPPPDPASRAKCLNDRAYVAANTGDKEGTLRYALQALALIRASGLASKENEAYLLATVARGYDNNGRYQEALQYYEQALQKFTELGTENAPAALTTRSNWAWVIDAAGAPKRALQIYDEIASTLSKRDPDGELPSFLVANQARAQRSIGRFDEARTTFQRALQLAVQSKNDVTQTSCLIGLGMTAVQLQDTIAAERYLGQAAELLGPERAKSGPKLAQLRGRLDLAAGRFAEARREFERAIALDKGHTPTTIEAGLGKAEAELRAGDANSAAADARLALNIAIAHQAGLPYSNQTGHSWLMLGLALRQLGDSKPAHEAFKSAVNHLSNTVDETHPALKQARSLALR